MRGTDCKVSSLSMEVQPARDVWGCTVLPRGTYINLDTRDAKSLPFSCYQGAPSPHKGITVWRVNFPYCFRTAQADRNGLHDVVVLSKMLRQGHRFGQRTGPSVSRFRFVFGVWFVIKNFKSDPYYLEFFKNTQ